MGVSEDVLELFVHLSVQSVPRLWGLLSCVGSIDLQQEKMITTLNESLTEENIVQEIVHIVQFQLQRRWSYYASA